MILTYAPIDLQPSGYPFYPKQSTEYVLPKTENKNVTNFVISKTDSVEKLIDNQTKRNIIHWLNSMFPIIVNKFPSKLVESLMYEIIMELDAASISSPKFIETADSVLIHGSKNDKMFHLEIFSDEEFESGYEAKINIIKNRQIILHSSGKVSELFGKL